MTALSYLAGRTLVDRNRGYQRIPLPPGQPRQTRTQGLRYALHQIFALDGVGHEVDSSSIRNLCLAGAPTAAQEVSPGCMEQVIAVELVGKRLHQGEAGIGSVGHCDRDCSVQLDHR